MLYLAALPHRARFCACLVPSEKLHGGSRQFAQGLQNQRQFFEFGIQVIKCLLHCPTNRIRLAFIVFTPFQDGLRG